MFETIIDAINTFLYIKLLIVILIGSGIYFTIRTRFPQVRLFRKACNAVMEKPEGKEIFSLPLPASHDAGNPKRSVFQ